MRQAIAAAIRGLALVALLAGAVAQAEEQTAPPDGAQLYRERTCIACHGADAKTPILPEYPKLAGQNPAYAFQQMKDIKSGARSNANTAAMKGVMFLVDEEEMKLLADYLASLAP